MTDTSASDAGAPVGDAAEGGKLRAFPGVKKALLVVGMHRSGTSAMTRVLNLLGADLPKRLLPPVADNNAAGFWESQDVVEIHDELLESAGSSWDDVSPLPDSWFSSQAADVYAQRVLKILRRDFAASDLFVVKDPRLAKLLPLWQTILKELGAEPIYVLIFRNPLEVAASLRARDGFLPAKSYLLWLWHVLEVERHSRGQRRGMVMFDELLKDWRSCVQRLQEDLGVVWPRRSAEAEVEIEEFLSARHRHHEAGLDELEASGDVVSWAKRAYLALREAVSEGGNTLSTTLDEIRHELAAADVAYAPLVAKGRIRLARKQAEIQRLGQELETRERHIEELGAKLGERGDEAEQLRTEAGQLRTDAEQVRSEVERLGDEVRERDGELAARLERIAGLEDELKVEREQNERLADELRAKEATIARLGDELTAQVERLGAQGEKVAAQRARLGHLGEELAAQEKRSTALGEELAQRHLEIESLTGELASRSEAVDSLRREIRERQEKTTLLKQELESELQARDRDLAARDREAGRLLAELEAARREEHELCAALAERTEAVNELEDHLDEANARVEVLQDELEAARRSIADLDQRATEWQTQLARVVRSRSWRATMPLRWLAAKTRGLFGLVHLWDRLAIGPDSRRLRRLRRQFRSAGAESLFDRDWYRSQSASPEEIGADPVLHYLEHGMAEARDPHPLFDTSYYLERHPDVARSGTDPLLDYVLRGAADGRDPHPLFDTSHYLEQIPDLAASGENPLVHYLSRGAAEGRDPHPLFDTSYYLEQHPGVAESGVNPLLDYVLRGAADGGSPHPLFDTSHYLEQIPDRATSGECPLSHYLRRGAAEGRDPHPLFDTSYYLEQHPEVARSGVDPLLDYVSRGAAKRRNPHPLFDTSHYLEQAPDLTAPIDDPLSHYLARGAAEGRDPHYLFDTSFYLEQAPELAESGENPLQHYIRSGAAPGPDPHPLFDTSFYLENHPECADSGMTPLEHFLTTGAERGARACGNARALRLIRPFVLTPDLSSCFAYFDPSDPPPRPGLRIGVYASSVGNYFFQEIQEVLIGGLRGAGCDAVPLDETAGAPILDYRMVIAPHEFFFLGRGREAAGDPAFRDAILVSTEQLQTPWFAISLPHLLRARTTLDINFQVAAGLRELGVNSHFLPLGFVGDIDWMVKDVSLPRLPAVASLAEEVRSFQGRHAALRDRPIDLLFIGALSRRREEFFASAAARLSRYECFFHLYEADAPLIAGETAELDTRAVTGLSQRSKILLNIHQSDTLYFEWQRIVMQGILQNTLVISERCLPIPGLEPGRHYLECDLEDFPDAVQWVLESQEGNRQAEALRAEALTAVRRNFDLASVMKSVVTKLLRP